MSRVKRGTQANKKRERILRQTKGYKWARKSKERAAKEALIHAGKYAFRDRKNKKRNFRNLWQIKINAAARINGTTYSSLINALKTKNILLNRRVLSEIAENDPRVFAEIVSFAGASDASRAEKNHSSRTEPREEAQG